jgi:signal transduction histidine kinase/DNA-binding response OmpR family regulator
LARILVVDDEPLVVRTLTALLQASGFEARSAATGEQALELLAHGRVDLVFLDVILPGLSGLETCALIRERHGPALPVVMISARPDREIVRAGYEAGADDFMSKPVDALALVLKVRVLLRLKALHDELLTSQSSLRRSVADLELLHEIGRDWSLIAQPEEFYRMVTGRLAALIGAPICLVALYHPEARELRAALPAHGLPDAVAERVRYLVTPEYRALWSFRSGRPYVSNNARNDPRLVGELVELIGAESLVLVPMVSEGRVLGLIVAVNKPGGFTDGDVQLLSIFAGPAATFLRSREIFTGERRHAARLEQMAELARDMAAARERGPLLSLTVSRIRQDFACASVAFHACDEAEAPALQAEAQAGAPEPASGDLLRFAARGSRPLRGAEPGHGIVLAVPVRAGEQALGVLELQRPGPGGFSEDEENVLSALAGQLAVTLQSTQNLAAAERLARQMATLYDVGLETSALRDLRPLFMKATEEAGRLIRADHTSVFRFEEASGNLGVFAAWARQPSRELHAQTQFRLGEGIAGRVAVDLKPAMINDSDAESDFVPKGNPVKRLLCVPLTYWDRERGAAALFGVLNATRRPGEPRFTQDDLEYLMRFASQLSIAVANAMAFAAERERSEQLGLVNTLIREIAGSLSRERILQTAAWRIHEAFLYPRVTILVPGGDGEGLRAAVRASREPQPHAGADEPASASARRALAEGRTVVSSGTEPGAGVELAVPIRSGEDLVAVLSVESDDPRGGSRGVVITLETLADGIGIILRNAELYQALESTNARLVELDRTKSELVNIVAHDFRAPLAGVLGFAELLEWKPDASPDQRLEYARSIIQSATHMAAMVDKTLKTTRLETGHFPFDFGVVDLGAAIREAAGRQPGSQSHPLVMALPEAPLPCWADRERIGEVVENLLSNAVKYSPQGGEIRIEATVVGEEIAVQVRDRGIGIASDDMGRLFRAFSRVRSRETADIEGTGLGLYICERIVRAHGGRMAAESTPGRGSLFGFWLPLFSAAAQRRAPLLLLAAVDASTRREVRRVAEEMGFGVHEAADGVEAVETALRLAPNGVILDRVLPRMGAVEVAERLRETPATARIPLFVLAAQQDLGERAALFRACIPKPLERAALAAALEAGLAQRAPGA